MNNKSLELIPIYCKRKQKKFDLFNIILSSIKENKQKISNNDILIISSKFVSISQGNIIKLKDIKPTQKALDLSSKFNMEPELVQIILNDSDSIYGAMDNFILSIKDNVICPNAGIDTSNIPKGYVVPYPLDIQKEADDLRLKFKKYCSIDIGIIFSDSRLSPTRIGTTGVAVTVSGFNPSIDKRGQLDLFGNELRVTQIAIADNLSSAAQLLMGEGNESIPIVIARSDSLLNIGLKFSNKKLNPNDLSINHNDCIFLKGLSNRYE